MPSVWEVQEGDCKYWKQSTKKWVIVATALKVSLSFERGTGLIFINGTAFNGPEKASQ